MITGKEIYKPPDSGVIFDLETTGFASSASILEIGAVKFDMNDGGTPAAALTFQCLIEPPEDGVPSEITQLTGITEELLEEKGIPLRSALDGLLEFMGVLPMIAYNAGFDTRILGHSLRTLEYSIPNSYLCLLKCVRRHIRGLPSYKLANVCESVGINTAAEEQHRALGDARLSAQLYYLLYCRLHGIPFDVRGGD